MLKKITNSKFVKNFSVIKSTLSLKVQLYKNRCTPMNVYPRFTIQPKIIIITKWYTSVLKYYSTYNTVSIIIPVIIFITFIYSITNSSAFMTWIWNSEAYFASGLFKSIVDIMTGWTHHHWDLEGFILRWFHVIPFEVPYYFELSFIDYYDPTSLETNNIIDIIDIFSTELFLMINFLVLVIWVLFTNKAADIIYLKFISYSVTILTLSIVITWFNPVAFGHTFYWADSWIAMDITTNFMKLVIIIFSICTFISLKNYNVIQTLWVPIFFWICIVTLLIGFMIQHIFILALVLETLSFLTIVLLAVRNSKTDTTKTKFSFYYLIINGILSIPMWLGIVFIYSMTTNLSYIGITTNILEILSGISINNELILSIGTNWVTVTFLFKLTSAPLVVWVIDIYEVATLAVLGFIMGTLKFGIFGLFLKFYTTLCLPFKTVSLDLIFGIVILTSYIFSFGAIIEQTIKKIIVFTSVNQIGYILLGLLIGTPGSLNSSLTYMLIYTLTITTIFICLSSLTPQISEKWSITFGDFYQVNKKLGVILLILFFSLAGIPPLAGFYIKYNILALAYFYGGIYNNMYILFALISSTILLLVYLQIIVSILKFKRTSPIPAPSFIKIKNEKYNLPKLVYFILLVNTALILFFDWIIIHNYDLIMIYLDWIISVYYCPNSHFEYEYAQFRRYAFFLFFYKNDYSCMIGHDLQGVFFFTDI